MLFFFNSVLQNADSFNFDAYNIAVSQKLWRFHGETHARRGARGDDVAWFLSHDAA